MKFLFNYLIVNIIITLMSQRMANQFDTHIGQINRLYQKYWSINEYMYNERNELSTQLQSAFTTTLRNIGEYKTLENYMLQFPNIAYDAKSFKVYLDEKEIDIYEWLNTQQYFIEFNHPGDKKLWKVYNWNLDRIIEPNEYGYNSYFALLWSVTDTDLSDDLIDFQIKKGFAPSKLAAINKLRKITLQYPGLLAKEKFGELIDLYAGNGSDQPSIKVQPSDNEDKVIIISKPKVIRKEGDNATLLTLKQTKKLFSYLRDTKVIFKDTSYQSGDNINKAIQALTGYNSDSLRKHKDLAAINISDLEKIREAIDKVKSLISRELKYLRDHRENL